VKQLSGQDASFLYLEAKHAHLHLTALYVYKQAPGKRLAFEDIFRHVDSRLKTTEVFRQKFVRPPLDLDYPYWVDDDNFDLAKHLRRYEGPPPGNRQQLFELVGEMHSSPLDLSRPPWEMYVLEKLGRLEGLPKSCFAIIAKYHHAAIDGASGSQLVDGLHSFNSSEIGRGADESWSPARGPRTSNILFRALVNGIREPFRLARTLAGAVPAIAAGVLNPSGGQERKTGRVPKTRFNQRVGSDRVFHSLSLGLDEVRSIRDAVDGSTVNDVILAICGGALREWLDTRQELPAESLVSMIPVNARARDEQSLRGNKLGVLFVPIHTEIADPVARLRAIHRATRKAKSAGGGLDARRMSQISNHIPAITLSATSHLITRLGLGYRAMNLCNCTITNVPGPSGTLFLGPARLVFTTGCAPIIDGMGLLISAFSYEGLLNLSFTSCPEMLPDAAFLTECAQRAFDGLLQDSRQ